MGGLSGTFGFPFEETVRRVEEWPGGAEWKAVRDATVAPGLITLLESADSAIRGNSTSRGRLMQGGFAAYGFVFGVTVRGVEKVML